jgi:hypothetical protein
MENAFIMDPNDTNSSWLPPIPPYSATSTDPMTTPDLPSMPPPSFGTPYVSASAATSPAPRRRLLPILGGVAAAVAVVLLVVAGVIFARSGRLNIVGSTASSPTATAQKMCQALQQSNVSAAYTLLSPSLTGAIPQARYTAGAHALAEIKGAVSKCTLGTAKTTGNSATVPVTITYAKSSESLTWNLSNGSAGWQLTQTPDPAIDPLGAAALYCTDLAQSNPAGAYALLSSTGQQASGGSETTFASNVQSDESLLGSLTNCAFQQVAISGSTATINAGMNFSGGLFNNLPGQFTVALGSQPPSLIDGVSISIAGLPIPFPVNAGSIPGLTAGA